ncbi:hypothetical protein MRB53_038502 [Persea americana]|nr:hypothetical protein MRB53_038502 [Persea americana]
MPVNEGEQVDELYPLVASESSTVQSVAFEFLHKQIPKAQEQLSVDVVLDKSVARLPEELLSLIIQSPRCRTCTAARWIAASLLISVRIFPAGSSSSTISNAPTCQRQTPRRISLEVTTYSFESKTLHSATSKAALAPLLPLPEPPALLDQDMVDRMQVAADCGQRRVLDRETRKSPRPSHLLPPIFHETH